jgi:hypothetical protein
MSAGSKRTSVLDRDTVKGTISFVTVKGELVARVDRRLAPFVRAASGLAKLKKRPDLSDVV